MTISEKTLKFSVVSITVTENFSDFSLIPSGFSLNEIVTIRESHGEEWKGSLTIWSVKLAMLVFQV